MLFLFEKQRMISIGLLSDTHGFFDPRLTSFFSNCNEIWHAGDIGNLELADTISSLKPFKAVYGNIDGMDVRSTYPLNLRFKCEDMDVWITHIGGYPGNYDRSVRSEIYRNPPNLFISGHSHILKVIPDKKLNLLHINPGAAGKSGFHKVRTAVRFKISGSRIHDLEVWEVNR
jgi:putative phosphoesterase